jgi:hypothetical protein
MESAKEWLKSTSSKLKKYNDYREVDHKALYEDELGRLAERYGRPLVDAGVDACLRDTKREHFGFKPLPEEFEDYVRAVKEKIGIRYGSPKRNCTFCDETGWMSHPRQPGKVTKCECRRIQ